MKMLKPVDLWTNDSFQRNSVATYIDKTGTLKVAAVNQPRFDYNPATFEPKGLLIESSPATNLSSHSEDLTDAVWLKTSYGLSSNVLVAPDGTTTGDEMNVNAGGSLARTYTVSANTDYVFSYFFQYDTLGYNYIAVYNQTNSTWIVAEAEPLFERTVKGWVRQYFTFKTPAGCTSVMVYYHKANVNGSSQGYFGFWGAQFETGTFPTSYIPTTTTTVTRWAESPNMIVSGLAEDEHATYSNATTYSINQRVIYLHNVYESLVDSNLNFPPDANPLKWLKIGATNAWKMFDSQTGTQTIATGGTIDVAFVPGYVTSLALLELDAKTITVNITIDGKIIYSKVVTTSLADEIANWYAYFTETAASKTDVVLTDLNSMTNAIVSVNIDNGNASAKCGMCITGTTAHLGEMQWAPRIGIVDYSKKEIDEFGNAKLVKRGFSKRMSADLVIDNKKVDGVAKNLAEYRATPVVWIGEEEFSSTVVYGFYRDFEIVIESPAGSRCSLQVEGLI